MSQESCQDSSAAHLQIYQDYQLHLHWHRCRAEPISDGVALKRHRSVAKDITVGASVACPCAKPLRTFSAFAKLGKHSCQGGHTVYLHSLVLHRACLPFRGPGQRLLLFQGPDPDKAFCDRSVVSGCWEAKLEFYQNYFRIWFQTVQYGLVIAVAEQEWMWAALDVFIVATSLWEVFVDTWYAIVEAWKAFLKHARDF